MSYVCIVVVALTQLEPTGYEQRGKVKKDTNFVT